METLQQQRKLVASLQDPACYDHAVERVELIETHISWVLLAGDYAYKLKKGVDFGFLDYSSLARRKQQCEEELRLNHRTAPRIYLKVVSIGGSPDAPQLNQEPAIEYAVKMRRFAQDNLLSHFAARGDLDEEKTLTLADAIAEFHAHIDTAPADSPFGTPECVYHPVAENFEQIRERITDPALRGRLDKLEEEARGFFARHGELFAQRKAEGHIRDCHGDLHLNNILLLEGMPLLFDCIEFNPGLRIIDVISELAFLVMDLQQHQRPELGNLLLNRYLERTGDYNGLRLMRFYLGYRAMVRAKVATLRLDQAGLSDDETEAVLRDFNAYLELAESYAKAPRPQLLITHGLSGSGKSTLTQSLLAVPGVVRLRSDVERKRLFGLNSLVASHSTLGEDIYSAEASRRTYRQLLQLADAALQGGYSVVVDATFLQRDERGRFSQLARQQQVPFTLLNFQADPATLHLRVRRRSEQGGDASEADNMVLQQQLEQYQAPGKDEGMAQCIIDSEGDDAMEAIRERLAQSR